MIWEKMGHIYVPDGSMPWAKSHAMLPTPLLLGDGRIRLYVAFVNENMVGRIGFVDVAEDNPSKLLRVSAEPVLDIGEPGSFDDNGVVPTCLVRRDDELWLYYVGFQLGVHVRYFMFSGLAVSRDGGESFVRRQTVPVLDRGDGERLFRTAPYVIPHGDQWRVWYVGGDTFLPHQDSTLPTYELRQANSPDGIVWPRTGRSLFPFKDDDEIGFGRPWVIREGGRFRMWYSIRHRSVGYRLGYAESEDGDSWARRDSEFDFDVSTEGWDSEMVCYTSILKTPHATYLFYNGNQFGRTGIGYAKLAE